MPLPRRSLLAGITALPLVAPCVAAAQAARVPQFIPQTDPNGADLPWSTVYITRNHAKRLYDTLYGTSAANTVPPKMWTGYSLFWNLKRG